MLADQSGHYWLLLWLIASNMSLAGLLTIWAALSCKWWFVRAAVIIGSAWLLVLVPAYDLATTFLAQVATVAIPLLRWRGWRARVDVQRSSAIAGKFHYRLRDLFLITALVAATVAFIVRIPEATREWVWVYLTWGAAAGSGSLAACAVLLKGWRWILPIVIPCAVVSLPARLSKLLGDDVFLAPAFLYEWDCPEWMWYFALPLATAVMILWLLLWRASHRPVPLCPALGSRALLARASLVVLSSAIMCLPALAVWQALTPTPVAAVTLPEPNAYVLLERLGSELDAIEPPDSTASEAALRAFVEKNRGRLDNLRAALTYDSIVPLDYSPGDMNVDGATAVHALACSWLAEGRVDQLDHRCQDAGDVYLSMVRAAVKTSRGGLLVDRLVSNALMGSGLDELERVRTSLSFPQQLNAIEQLMSTDAGLEPIQQIIRRDEVWMEHKFGWPHRVRFLREPPPVGYKSLDDCSRAELRLLACDLAVRCYEHEHSHLPESLDDLVPDYFLALPHDPFTSQPFVYRCHSTNFQLYSTGPDQVDNGGIRNSQTRPPPAGEDLPLKAPKGCWE